MTTRSNRPSVECHTKSVVTTALAPHVVARGNDTTHERNTRRHVRADNPGDRIAIRDRERIVAAEGSLRKKLLAGTRSAQEREMGAALEFGVARHRNTPCRNQRCDPVSRF